MSCPSFLIIFFVGVVCSFCGQDFVSLGRHAWRCKEKIHRAERPSDGEKQMPNPVDNGPRILYVKCCCGKVCKGNRGLKMHQRSCRVVWGLNDELRADLNNNNTGLADQEFNADSVNVPLINSGVPLITQPEKYSFPEIKQGINLPKTEDQWSTANEYFKSVLLLNLPITAQNLDSSIKLLNDTIYDYFSTNFGKVSQVVDKNLMNKYKDKSKHDLKKSLKVLKHSNADITEIKYVSRLLRDKLQNKSSDLNSDSVNHDFSIANNFWGYVKKMFNKKDEILPSFSMNECFNYFTASLSSVNPTKVFHLPSWIPVLSEPVTPFKLEPPTYEQISTVIRKMKASGSPCPLDQLSIICFKRCPFLRTYLSQIIRTAWVTQTVPSEWKKACTILIHKKGNTNDPANFRPITLQSVPLKVFTSCLRNAIFKFLAANNFIEHAIQKGFTPDLSGTFEHTAQMAHIIDTARIKQRSLVITLLDLKNAFGEVHHNLIQAVLEYHHIPDHIKILIKSLIIIIIIIIIIIVYSQLIALQKHYTNTQIHYHKDTNR